GPSRTSPWRDSSPPARSDRSEARTSCTASPPAWSSSAGLRARRSGAMAGGDPSRNGHAGAAPEAKVAGWGRIPVAGREVRRSDLEDATRDAVLTRGLGRSYRDAALDR